MIKPTKTNARLFLPNLKTMVRYPLLPRLKQRVIMKYRRLCGIETDEYVWNTYHEFYGPENEAEKSYWTYDLSEVDFEIINGIIFTIADAKPLNAWHRVLFEAIINLPEINSIHEVGTGGGKLIVNLGKLVGEKVSLGASDIAEGQLALFCKHYRDEFAKINPFVHDITRFPLPDSFRADLLFTATVLMHIRRSDTYYSAIKNLLASARKFLVLLENWQHAHDYVRDIREVLTEINSAETIRFYAYDSGAAMAMVIALKGQDLPEAYRPITNTSELQKYT